MNVTELIGRMLGLEEAQTIQGYQPSLGARWAHDAPAWIFFACLALIALVVLFYAAAQRHKRAGVRVVLAVFRAVALCLIVLMLAEPVLTVRVTSQKRPALWFLFDGTDSMGIADELAEADREDLAEAVGLGNGREGPENAGGDNPSRMDYVKALVQKEKGNLLEQLEEKFRVKAFLFDRPDGVRSLELAAEGREKIDREHLAQQLTAEGEVTALGAALGDLTRRHSTGNVAGLVILSDFNQNAGPAALAAAKQLGVQIHTVGVGATAAADVALSVQAPLHVKKGERGDVVVTVRQKGLEGQSVNVRLFSGQIGEDEADSDGRDPIDEKTVTLAGALQEVEFPYVPEEAGRFMLVAEVEQVTGETVKENNVAQREITVLEDFLRLLFVEYEPTWEWRFIKEVFHRDKLVGTEGFRTYLRSSDPRVRQTKEMFLPTMSLPRSEFFAYDVIFLGDMPASALSEQFCKMTEEFVRVFGGGLVVLCGPRFGPGELVGASQELGKLLPVKVNPGARINDRRPFRLQLSPRAMGYSFMQLGGTSEAENQRAWANLGPLPWYQPVERLHHLATPLAVHPTHTCIDGSQQPLIAIRPYGQGEVVYLGFDETWRLRRRFGERYYRQFWGQMIHRLGLSHELGAQKRFVVRTDRRSYQADDNVLLTVEAYDSEFRPLSEKDLPAGKLSAELINVATSSVGLIPSPLISEKCVVRLRNTSAARSARLSIRPTVTSAYLPRCEPMISGWSS